MCLYKIHGIEFPFIKPQPKRKIGKKKQKQFCQGPLE